MQDKPDNHQRLADHPIFICGHPKSGTSLITALLDSHPELIVFPEETMFFRRFLPSIKSSRYEAQLKTAEVLLLQIFTWNHNNPPPSQAGYLDRDYSDISYEAVMQAFQQRIARLHRHPGDFLSAAILAYGEEKNLVNASSKGWVEKTPYNEYYARLIFDWWPQAKCIHILRDPRDNFVSYQKKHADWTASNFAWNWAKSTKVAFINQKMYSNDHYWIVRYEDLVNQPEEIIGGLCRFLDIQPDQTLYQPSRNGISWQGNSMFADKFNAISAAPIGRWKSQLNDYDLAMMEAILMNLMNKANYPLNSSSGWENLYIRQKVNILWAVLKKKIKGYSI